MLLCSACSAAVAARLLLNILLDPFSLLLCLLLCILSYPWVCKGRYIFSRLNAGALCVAIKLNMSALDKSEIKTTMQVLLQICREQYAMKCSGSSLCGSFSPCRCVIQ